MLQVMNYLRRASLSPFEMKGYLVVDPYDILVSPQ